MVKKVYVLDTNVILADVNCFYSFKTSNILIPLKVVQELDKHKKSEILGFNARTAIKFIDGLRQKGSINSGVKIGKGFGILQVAGHEDFRMPSEFPLSDPDNQILATALSQKSKIENKDKKFIVVSNDVNLRIKCDALGLECTDFKEDHVIKNRAELFTGAIELLVDDVLIDRFYRGEEVVPNVVFPENLKLFPNQFLVLISSSNEKKSALAQFVSWSLPLLKVKEGHKGDWGLVAKNKEQQFAMSLLMNPAIPLVTLVGQAGTGKAQPLTSKILTPRGWTTMGEIQKGDEVCTPDGKIAKVLETFPQGVKKIYKITFTDGSSTECCEEHLWNVKDISTRRKDVRTSLDNGWLTKSLKEISKDFLIYDENRNYNIPIVKIAKFEEKKLPIHPYLLGAFLGDGGWSQPTFTFTSADKFIVDKINGLLRDLNCIISPYKKTGVDYFCKMFEKKYYNRPIEIINIENKTKYNFDNFEEMIKEKKFSITGCRLALAKKDGIYKGFQFKYLNQTRINPNSFVEKIKKLGLYGTKSNTKFIPDDYKMSSKEDRINLLQGLMDTDGSVEKNGKSTTYTTVSKKLCEGVCFIVCSLGGTAKVSKRTNRNHFYKGENRKTQDCYKINLVLPADIQPFSLPRKAERVKPRKINKDIPRRFFDKIEFVGEKEAKCILIDHPDHLYITDDFIVTHNTLLSLGCALEQVNFSKKSVKNLTTKKAYDRILVTRPIVAMGKDIGFLPGTIQEKLSPWLGGIQDNLRTLMGNDELMLEEYSKQKIIEMEALTYIRGRSIPNSFIIIDECFPGDQLVLGENGQKYAIYDLFRDTLHNRKLPKVLSFNEETNKFEKNKILSITRKEKPRSLLELKIAGTKFNPTEEHPFLCYDKGWVKAKDLEVGDPIVSYGENKKSFKVLNEDQEQVIFGMCLGPNVKLKRTGRSKFAISSVFDKEERKEHFLKIKEILGGRIDPVIVADKIDYFEFVKNKRKHEKNEKFTSDYFYYTPEIIYKVEGYKFDYILSRIDRRGWAIFYQESVVHHEEFGPVLEVRSLYDEENYINKTINSLKNLGYDCEIVGKKFIKLKGTSFNDFASWVAPYVFECNKWLLPKKPEQFYAWKYKEADIWVSLVENKKNSKRKEFVFDLEIENNHNFIVSSPYQDNYGVVVHNCQNLTRHEVKTILTRVGEGSKIVLIGDIEQIDNVNLDETNNGLTYVIEKFKPEAIAGHTTLVKGERSILATRASKLL